MRTDHWYPSQGEGMIHYCKWTPDGEIKAVIQIVHGIAEYGKRYDDFAEFLNHFGVLVVADDHMGHGESMKTGTKGYFAGGWFTAVADTYHLLTQTMEANPNVPYILFGHSMGSFMTRTILARYPDSGISAAVLCGTGWQPELVVRAGSMAARIVCARDGDRCPSPLLQKIAFGSYNKKIEHPRTEFDWLNRNDSLVDAYMLDPLCGQTATAGLMRDLLEGIAYNQNPDSLSRMRKDLPVLFISGGDDPVGNYGKGVRLTAQKFREAGMKHVSVRIYPLCRHEILNELNHSEVYRDIKMWIGPLLERNRFDA